jgi:hypothetical protein
MAFRTVSPRLRRQASNAVIAVIGATTLALLTLSPTGVSALSSMKSVAGQDGAPQPTPLSPQDSSAPPGLADAPAGTDIGIPGRGVVRSRAVVVLLDAFPSTTATAPATVALPMFEDVRVEARLDPALTSQTHRSWRGVVAGGGDVVLVERNGFIAGSVTSPQGRFRLRAIEGGVSVVEEIDPQSFPEAHEHPLPPEGTATATADAGAVRLRAGVSTGTQAHEHGNHDHSDSPVAVSAASLPGSGDAPAGAGLLAAPALVMAGDGEVITIDVLVAYSTAAKTRMGGTGPVEADIALAIEQTNTAFATSDVAARLRLVGSPEVPTNGNVTGAVLDSVRNPGNGDYDNLHTLRDALGADLVALIVDDTANQYCGIAYQMGPNGNSPAFASAAFSVTDVQCSTGALTFPHELGHNFGAAHDRGAWSGTPVYPYGYGWVNAAGHWRDVMSYANACAGCTRLLRYSNPDQTYNGAPIGSPIGTPLQADNRAVFNATAGVVASFRGVPVPTSLTVLAPAAGSAVAVPGPLTVRWNAAGAIGGSVKVELLRGSSVVAVLAPAAATGVGAVTWKAPATLPRGSDYAVRLASVANPAATTTSDPFSVTDPAITLTSSEGESWAVGTAHPVTWTYTGTPTGGVKLELLRAERLVATIAGAAPLGSNGQGTYSWTPPATLGAYADYRVRVTLASLPAVRDSTDQDLELTGGPRLSLTAPTAGANWAAGSSQAVSWTASGALGRTVKVELLLGTAVAAQVSAPGTSTSATLKLPPGLPSATTYTVRAAGAASPSLLDVAGPLTVDGSSLTLTSAEPGTWVAGGARIITWENTGTPGTALKVELVHPAARPLTLVASTPVAAGSATVRLPASIATNLTYRLRLTVVGNPLLTATGEELTATLPTLSVTEPGAVTAGQPATVGWAFSEDSAVPVVVELLSGVRVFTRVATAPTGAGGVGTYTWKVPATLPGGSYTLRVRPSTTATSDRIQGTSDLTVTGPTVTIGSPAGGSWARGSTQSVDWTTTSYAGTTAKAELMRGDKVAKALASAARMTGASGSLSVVVPTTLTAGTYTVRITLPGGATAQSPAVTVS